MAKDTIQLRRQGLQTAGHRGSALSDYRYIQEIP
jgi:hypothetical protein